MTFLITPESETLKRSWVLTSDAIRAAAEAVPAGGRPRRRPTTGSNSDSNGTPTILTTTTSPTILTTQETR